MKKYTHLIVLITLLASAVLNSLVAQTPKDSLYSMLNKAFFHVEMEGKEKLSLELISKAESFARNNVELHTDPFFNAMTRAVRTRALYNLGDFKQCVKLITQGLIFAEEANSKLVESYFLAIYGHVGISTKDYELAKEQYVKAIEVLALANPNDEKLTAIDVDLHKIDVYYSLADVHYRPFLNWRFNLEPLSDEELKTTLEKASEYAEHCLHYLNKTQKREGRKPFMFLVKGQNAIEQNKFNEAKKHLDTYASLIDFETDHLNKFRLSFALGNYYKKIKKIDSSNIHYEKAYKYSRHYEDARYLVFKNRLNNELDYLTKDLKAELLSAELSIVKAEKFKTTTALVLTSLVIMGLVLFSYLQMRFIRKTKLINKELHLKNQQILKAKKQKDQLEHIIQNIQERISRDLHDNFGNRISAISQTGEVLKDLLSSPKINVKQVNKFLNNIEKSIGYLNSDIKDLLWANGTENNTFKILINRLEQFTNELSVDENNIKIEKNIDKDYVLPKLWNRQLLLIFKEAITNGIKHSKNVNSIVLIFEGSNGNLKITYQDKGVGFNIDKIDRIAGLNNMKKRAKTMDCNFSITSKINHGTTIILEMVPIEIND